MAIDSLKDIGVNKLATIHQRTEVKDFVDLYYLLQKFTFWDLLYGIENKFRLELDLVFAAAGFLRVEKFDFLPKMIKPLTLEELKKFFRLQAREIGGRITE